MDRWRQIDSFFHAALELAPADRAAFLDEACGEDESLRREVESLLIADDDSEGLTARLPVQAAGQVAAEMLKAESPRFSSSESIGHYRIISPLGAGGMGEVYLAEDTRLKRKVALKVLPTQFTSNPDRVRRFEQEAHAVSALNHPNIITLFELGRAENHFFMATEYIDGQTLRERLREVGRLPVVEAIEIASQICLALAAAHDAGIIHRDIKPENVMLRADGFVKVLDFGLAKIDEDQGGDHASLTNPGTVMGTASYMSPEQARGERVDARTDSFSLGVVFYEMIAGQAPFAGGTVFEIVASILNNEPQPLDKLPANLQRIVEKTLNKDRAARFQTIRELNKELKQVRLEPGWEERAASGKIGVKKGQAKLTSPAPGRATSGAQIIFSEIRRHKLRAAATLALAGAVIAGGVIGLYKVFGGKSDLVKSSTPGLKITPFTFFTGLESKPSFSPDGRQISFNWVGEKGDNTDIYIKEIGGREVRRLTTNPAIDSDAVWSPDGSQIAFFRFTEKSGAIYLMPASGGAESKIAEISPLRPPQIMLPEMSWSPDGKMLAFPDRNSSNEPLGIVLLTIETGERRQLIAPVPNSTGDYTPVFSPDGKTIAFNRSVNSESERDIYLISVAGGEPQKVTSVNTFLTSVDWLPDGKGIIYVATGGRSEVTGSWKLSLPNGVPERITGREAAGLIGVIFARKSGLLAGVKSKYDIDIWRMGLQAGKSDNRLPARFISSTTTDISVKYSEDGRKIAFVSDRSGETLTWICNEDGQNPVQFNIDKLGACSTPTWSPDGSKIAFISRVLGQGDIYVANADGGQPVRLSTDASNNGRPLWSHDGRWIYFSSNRLGSWQLRKMPSGGGDAALVAKQRVAHFAESWDGKFLVYSKGFMIPGIWRFDLTTGEETLLTDLHNAGYWHSWDLSPKGVFFATCETPLSAMIEFYDFATGKVSLVTKLKTPFPAPLSGLSVSPDGRWLCYLQQEVDADIITMENFR